MATYNSLISTLRYYIGDLANNPTYENDTLNQYIIIAAQAVVSEINIPTTYTVSIASQVIDPDPTSDSSNQGVSNLFVLKAAVILSMSEARKDMAKYGIRIKDDVTSFDGTGVLKGRQDVIKMFVENYEKAKWEWEKGNKLAGRAILGPYESADLGYTSTNFTFYPEYGPSRR